MNENKTKWWNYLNDLARIFQHFIPMLFDANHPSFLRNNLSMYFFKIRASIVSKNIHWPSLLYWYIITYMYKLSYQITTWMHIIYDIIYTKYIISCCSWIVSSFLYLLSLSIPLISMTSRPRWRLTFALHHGAFGLQAILRSRSNLPVFMICRCKDRQKKCMYKLQEGRIN